MQKELISCKERKLEEPVNVIARLVRAIQKEDYILDPPAKPEDDRKREVYK